MSTKNEPLWKGPEEDGITQSLLQDFLRNLELLCGQGLIRALCWAIHAPNTACCLACSFVVRRPQPLDPG